MIRSACQLCRLTDVGLQALAPEQSAECIEAAVHILDLGGDRTEARPVLGAQALQHLQLCAFDIELEEVDVLDLEICDDCGWKAVTGNPSEPRWR
jgi:hypothetical protein